MLTPIPQESSVLLFLCATIAGNFPRLFTATRIRRNCALNVIGESMRFRIWQPDIWEPPCIMWEWTKHNWQLPISLCVFSETRWRGKMLDTLKWEALPLLLCLCRSRLPAVHPCSFTSTRQTGWECRGQLFHSNKCCSSSDQICGRNRVSSAWGNSTNSERASG